MQPVQVFNSAVYVNFVPCANSHVWKKWVSAHSANFCKWMVKHLLVDMVDYVIIIIIIMSSSSIMLYDDSSVFIHE